MLPVEQALSVQVFVRFQFFRGMPMVVRSVLTGVLMVVRVLTVRMFVLMSMPVSMAMYMSVRMRMCYAIAVRVLVSMGMRVFVLVAMFVLVFLFHVITSPARMLSQRRVVRKQRTYCMNREYATIAELFLLQRHLFYPRSSPLCASSAQALNSPGIPRALSGVNESVPRRVRRRSSPAARVARL